ncbi:glycosyltransferase family 2 protein [Weizmannia acidilactici]|uniref:glycosyltransferase family 2 protein n=1 Tax=Weizmannia acidilactici TaxID=2607726 RepID=UPI00124BD2D0|nr:glycosyltransferase family 2 protein [Weizmannia acidilactici]GER74421.1 glycosyl transferase [Weizmannia acidilactici]
MELSIIIVNYNSNNKLYKCLKSIEESNIQLSYEVIIVDNSSSDKSFIICKEKYKNKENFNFIYSEINLGFSRANNLAYLNSHGKYILVLNPDCYLQKNSIENMIREFESNQNIGIVCPQLLNIDGSVQDSVRKFPKIKYLLLGRFPFINRPIIKKYENEYLMRNVNKSNNMIVDWAIGACLLFKRSIINKNGFFDDKYFMYFEDCDICYRYKERGYNLLYVTSAKLIHEHQQQSRKKLSKATFYHFISMIKFYFSHPILFF